MGEVSESPSGNKSIRYLNSHYADVVSWNKESTSRRIVRGRERETEKEGSEPRRRGGGGPYPRTRLMLRVGKLSALSRIGQNFLSITELLFIAVIYYSKSPRLCHLSALALVSRCHFSANSSGLRVSLFVYSADKFPRVPSCLGAEKNGERFKGNFNVCDSLYRL